MHKPNLRAGIAIFIYIDMRRLCYNGVINPSYIYQVSYLTIHEVTSLILLLSINVGVEKVSIYVSNVHHASNYTNANLTHAER